MPGLLSGDIWILQQHAFQYLGKSLVQCANPEPCLYLMRWGPLLGVGLAVGLLTMIATSSPFPPANIPGHGLAFLLATYLARVLAPDNRELLVDG